MNVQERIRKALKRETGVRLSAAEVQGLASLLKIHFSGRDMPIKENLTFAPLDHAAQKPSKPHGGFIRWLIRRDLSAVLNIDAEAFTHECWLEEQFITQLRQNNCIGMVIEVGGVVVGFMVYELHKNRLVLQRIAVARQHRRRALGSQLIGKLQNKLSPDRRSRMVVDVPETNTVALLFLQDLGFQATQLTSHPDGSDLVTMEFSIDGKVADFHAKPAPSDRAQTNSDDYWMSGDDSADDDDDDTHGEVLR